MLYARISLLAGDDGKLALSYEYYLPVQNLS